MKKCKACNGKGFVFNQTLTPTNKTFYGMTLLRNTGVKVTCSKCFGNGVQNKQLIIFRN